MKDGWRPRGVWTTRCVSMQGLPREGELRMHRPEKDPGNTKAEKPLGMK